MGGIFFSTTSGAVSVIGICFAPAVASSIEFGAVINSEVVERYFFLPVELYDGRRIALGGLIVVVINADGVFVVDVVNVFAGLFDDHLGGIPIQGNVILIFSST